MTHLRDQLIAFFLFAIVCTVHSVPDELTMGCHGNWENWSPCSENSTSCIWGVKEREAVFDLTLLENVNCTTLSFHQNAACNPCAKPCEFSEWSGDSSTCSAECGIGSRYFNREVVREAEYGGDCPLVLTKLYKCIRDPCPEVCIWSPWSNINDCSAPCGGGTFTTERTQQFDPALSSEEREASGEDCSATMTEEIPCNDFPCETCGWTEWELYSPCTKICGGVQEMTQSRRQTGENLCTGEEMRNVLCSAPTAFEDCPLPPLNATHLGLIVGASGAALALLIGVFLYIMYTHGKRIRSRFTCTCCHPPTNEIELRPESTEGFPRL